jgi:serine/threonine-protein kinase
MGVVLWELLAGRRLFDEDTHAAIMHRVLSGRVPSLASMRSDVPAEIDGVLARALALDPHDRYASAEGFADALERWASGTPARVVAKEVRAAMDDAAPGIDASQSFDEAGTTPSECVASVRGRAHAPRSLASTLVRFGALVAAIGALGLLGFLGFARSVRPRPLSPAVIASPAALTLEARAPSTTALTSANANTNANASANANTSANTSANTTANAPRHVARPGSSVEPKGRAAPPRATRPRLAPAPSASVDRGRPLYDPEEL